jgi:hypothetical protein
MSTHHRGAGYGTTCFSCRKSLKISQAAATLDYKGQRWMWCFACWDADDAEQPGGAVDAYRIMGLMENVKTIRVGGGYRGQ